MPQPEKIPDDGEHFGADVELFTKDGGHFVHSVQRPLGRTSANSLPQSRLEAKFLDCAQRSITREAAEQALALLRRFDAVSRVAELTDILAAGCVTEPTGPTSAG